MNKFIISTGKCEKGSLKLNRDMFLVFWKCIPGIGLISMETEIKLTLMYMMHNVVIWVASFGSNISGAIEQALPQYLLMLLIKVCKSLWAASQPQC